MSASQPQEPLLSFAWAHTIGLLALLVYYIDERSYLHRHVVERIFWAFIYGWFGYVFLLLPDSPVVLLRSYGSWADAGLVLAMSVLGLRMQHRSQTRRMLSSIQRLDLHQLAKQQSETVAARIATVTIVDLLSDRQSYSGVVTSLLQQLWGMITGRTFILQEKVFQALKGCSESGLGSLLYVLNCGDVDLPWLFHIAGTDDVLHLLTQELRSVFDVVTKARLIDALQRQPDFPFVSRLQEAVVRLILQTHGEELTTLKDLLDEGGDFYNLHKLCYVDLRDDLRDIVLQHIRDEGFSRAKQIKRKFPCKVLSDVDDTLYCSGGHFPAGIDKRFPVRKVYPGVLALFREFNRHDSSKWSDDQSDESSPQSLAYRLFRNRRPVTNPLWLRVSPTDWVEASVSPSETIAVVREKLLAARQEFQCGTSEVECVGEGLADLSFSSPGTRVMSNLVFLSARPHAYKDYAESKSYRLFRQLRLRGTMHCMPTLLAGKMASSGRAALLGGLMQFQSHLGASIVVCLLGSFLACESLVHGTNFALIVVLCLFLYGCYLTRSITSATQVWKEVGEDKAKTFLQYRELYNEYSCVFFGDNGQGDLLCGERLGRLARKSQSELCDPTVADSETSSESLGTGAGTRPIDAPPCVSAVFIHEVIPRSEQLSALPPVFTDAERERTWRSLNIYFHRTYVGAAIEAHKLDMISQEGLSRVCKAAVEDLVRMRIECSRAGLDWEERSRELNEDVLRANKLLPEALQVAFSPSLTKVVGMATMKLSSSMSDFIFTTRAPIPDTRTPTRHT